MHSEFDSIAEELRTLATQADWSRTLSFLAQVSVLSDVADADGRSNSISIALIELGSPDPQLSGEIERVLGQPVVNISDCPTGDPGWLADHMIIALSCGEMPNSAMLQVLSETCFVRPIEATSLLLTQAEKVKSADDLRVVEAMASRWLLPPNSQGEPHAHIAAAGGYLWSNGPGLGAGIADRVATDRDAFVARIRQPLASASRVQLDQAKLLYATRLAQQEQSARGVDSSQTRDQVFEIQRELEQLRDRSLSRLRSDTDSLEAAIRVASEGLEQDLIAGLPKLFQEKSDALTDSTIVDSVFEKYCREVVSRWETQPKTSARQWSRGIEELTMLIRGAGFWSEVNAITESTVYPELLVGRLNEAVFEFPVAESRSKLAEESGGSSASSLITTFIGALLGAGAGMLIGFGPPAIVTGMGLGAMCGVLYRRHSNLNERRAAVERAARQEVSAIAREARSAMQRIVAERTHHLRSTLADGFATLQLLLDQKARARVQGASQKMSDADQLARLQKKLISLQID